jgi:hypothetical protein
MHNHPYQAFIFILFTLDTNYIVQNPLTQFLYQIKYKITQFSLNQET